MLIRAPASPVLILIYIHVYVYSVVWTLQEAGVVHTCTCSYCEEEEDEEEEEGVAAPHLD